MKVLWEKGLFRLVEGAPGIRWFETMNQYGWGLDQTIDGRTEFLDDLFNEDGTMQLTERK